jgi:undecaprenyl-diphosphatase
LDWVLLVKAALMGVVEGLTEFLPISSTGHLILAASLLDFTGSTVKVFEIAIQTGAMFAVIWEYRERLGRTVSGLASDPQAQRFARNVLIAFMPAVVLGLTFGKLVKEHLFHPVPVAAAFIVGGLIILWVERRHHAKFGERDLLGQRRARVESVDDMSALDSLKVGLVQCLALIPGTSRSGATIIGAMVFGFSRKCATDWEPYAQQMLEVLSAEPALVNTASGYAPKPDYRPLTKFEARGLNLGHGVWDLVFRLSSPPSQSTP